MCAIVLLWRGSCPVKLLFLESKVTQNQGQQLPTVTLSRCRHKLVRRIQGDSRSRTTASAECRQKLRWRYQLSILPLFLVSPKKSALWGQISFWAKAVSGGIRKPAGLAAMWDAKLWEGEMESGNLITNVFGPEWRSLWKLRPGHHS